MVSPVFNGNSTIPVFEPSVTTSSSPNERVTFRERAFIKAKVMSSFSEIQKYKWNNFFSKSPIGNKPHNDPHKSSAIGCYAFFCAIKKPEGFERALEMCAFIDTSNIDVSYWNDDDIVMFLKFLKEKNSVELIDVKLTQFERLLLPNLIQAFSLIAKLILEARSQSKKTYPTEDIFKDILHLNHSLAYIPQIFMMDIAFSVNVQVAKIKDHIRDLLSHPDTSNNRASSMGLSTDLIEWYKVKERFESSFRDNIKYQQYITSFLQHELNVISDVDMGEKNEKFTMSFILKNLLDFYLVYYDENILVRAINTLQADVKSRWFSSDENNLFIEWFLCKIQLVDNLLDLEHFIRLGIDLSIISEKMKNSDASLSCLNGIIQKIKTFFDENEDLINENSEEFQSFMQRVLEKILLLADKTPFRVELLKNLLIVSPSDHYVTIIFDQLLVIMNPKNVPLEIRFPPADKREKFSNTEIRMANKETSLINCLHATMFHSYPMLFVTLCKLCKEIVLQASDGLYKIRLEQAFINMGSAPKLQLNQDFMDALMSPKGLAELLDNPKAEMNFRQFSMLVTNLATLPADNEMKLKGTIGYYISLALKPLLIPKRFSLLEAILEESFVFSDIQDPVLSVNFQLLIHILIKESDKLTDTQKVILYDFQWRYAVRKIETAFLFSEIPDEELLINLLKNLSIIPCPVLRDYTCSPLPFHVQTLLKLSESVIRADMKVLLDDLFSKFMLLENYLLPFQLPLELLKINFRRLILLVVLSRLNDDEKLVVQSNLKKLIKQNFSFNGNDLLCTVVIEMIDYCADIATNVPVEKTQLHKYQKEFKKVFFKFREHIFNICDDKNLKEVFSDLYDFFYKEIECRSKIKLQQDKKEQKLSKSVVKTEKSVVRTKAKKIEKVPERTEKHNKTAIASTSGSPPVQVVLREIPIVPIKTLGDWLDELSHKEGDDLDACVMTICKELSQIPSEERRPYFTKLIESLSQNKTSAMRVIKKIIKQINIWSVEDKDALFFEICTTSKLPKSSLHVYNKITSETLKSQAFKMDGERKTPYLSEFSLELPSRPLLERRNTLMTLPSPEELERLRMEFSEKKKARRGSSKLVRRGSSANLPQAASSSSGTRSRSGSNAGQGLGVTFSPGVDVPHYKIEISNVILPKTLKELNAMLDTIYDEIALRLPEMAGRIFQMEFDHVTGSHFRFSLKKGIIDLGATTIATHGKDINEHTVGKVYEQIYAFIRKCQDNYWIE